MENEELNEQGDNAPAQTDVDTGSQDISSQPLQDNKEKEKARIAYQERKKQQSPDLSAKLDEIREELRAELRAEREAEALAEVASSDEEREAIRDALNNKIKRTGNLLEDLRVAKIVANSAKYEQVAREAGNVQNAKGFGQRTSGAVYGGESSESPYSPSQQALLARYGLDPKTGKPLPKN